MGILEAFTAYTKTLSPERLREVEREIGSTLRCVMLAEQLPELAPEQIKDLESRLANPIPRSEYIPLEEVMAEMRRLVSTFE